MQTHTFCGISVPAGTVRNKSIIIFTDEAAQAVSCDLDEIDDEDNDVLSAEWMAKIVKYDSVCG